MYKESMANGFAASVLFLLFLFLLIRHIRKLRTGDEVLPTVVRREDIVRAEYAMPPPPSYQEAMKMGAAPKY